MCLRELASDGLGACIWFWAGGVFGVGVCHGKEAGQVDILKLTGLSWHRLGVSLREETSDARTLLLFLADPLDCCFHLPQYLKCYSGVVKY